MVTTATVDVWGRIQADASHGLLELVVRQMTKRLKSEGAELVKVSWDVVPEVVVPYDGDPVSIAPGMVTDAVCRAATDQEVARGLVAFYLIKATIE